MKIGLMLDGVPKLIDGAPITLTNYITYIAKLGVQCVDLFDSLLESRPISLADLKSQLASQNMVLTSFCINVDLINKTHLNQSFERIKKYMDIALEFKSPTFFIYGSQHRYSGSDALNRYTENLNLVQDNVRSSGMLLAIENAGILCHTQEDLQYAMEQVKGLKLVIDPANFYSIQKDYYQITKLFLNDIIHVHAKNYKRIVKGNSFEFQYQRLRNGDIDYNQYIHNLYCWNYQNTIALESELQDIITDSLHYLKEILMTLDS